MQRHMYSLITLALAGAVCGVTPALGDLPDDACCSVSPYGDGSDGSVTISQNTQLSRDMDYRNLTVASGVKLDLNGHAVRVCATLLNYGTITDTHCGGAGGAGGDAGWGADPNDSPPGNPKPDNCSAGVCGDSGGSPVCDRGGDGGDGGDGGGGGGGAYYGSSTDADGGNGGAGGTGGQGGGWVLIYAWRLDNRGVIHADAEDGQDGEDGEDGEYFEWGCPLACKDLAGGGGGGGSGGDGGDGGVVEIHYGYLLNSGTMRAAAGQGGGRGYGGDGYYCAHTTVGGALQYGCVGCGGGGDGGDGEYRLGYYSDDGTNGGLGSSGTAGVVEVVYLPVDDCNVNGVPDVCDIYDGTSEDCNSNGVPDECELESVSVTSPSLSPIGFASSQSFTAYGMPRAVGNVTLTFEAIADLSVSSEYIDVYINGVWVGRVFESGAHDCPSTPDTDQIVVPMADYNEVSCRTVVVDLVASGSVDPGLCSDPASYITVAIEYAADNDGNDNGVPDQCEQWGDMNCSGVLNNFDIDAFVLALTSTPPDYPEYYAAYPDCDIRLGDCNGDGVFNNFDIDCFVYMLAP